MKRVFNRLPLALASAASVALLTLAGCGSGGGGGTTLESDTANVSATVIDGALKNALVCLDANGNGACDTGEVQGRTDAAGNVSLAVPKVDLGKYPILAVVDTDAVDADNGPVTQAYTLSAPASNPGVVSPLTTMVYQTMTDNGMTAEQAEKFVKSSTGITVSLFQDFTTPEAKAAAAASNSPNAGTVARMIVVATQAQSKAMVGSLGSLKTIDGKSISVADMNKAIQKKLLEILPALVTSLSDSTVTGASSAAAKEAAVVAALTANGSLLTTASLPTAVAINNQPAAPADTTVASGVSLRALNYFDANNWFVRTNTSSLAQATPDGNGLTRGVGRRSRANGGVVANWNVNSDPRRQSDTFWSGTAWAQWTLNCEGTGTVRDAAGNSDYVDCNNAYTGKSKRATFDISGQTMAAFLDQVKAAGYSNLVVSNPAVLGSATFPSGSKVFYQTSTDTSIAVAYSSGSDDWVTVSPQGSGTPTACASNAQETPATTLEAMVATFVGKPCIYPADTIVSNGVTYSSEGPVEAWGSTAVSMGQIGTASVSSTPTSYFTGNTRIRVAFTGLGSNEVTYYSCKQRQVSGFTRNCVPTGIKGTYAITTLGDGRVMTFTNLPPVASALNFERVFVERGGKVFYGYQSKFGTYTTPRLNTSAASAIFTQLGLPQVDPEVPLALTAASYQGTWDTKDPAGPAGNGSVLVFNSNGTYTCSDKPTGVSFSCTFNITNPATGAFTGMNNSNGSVLAGTLNFMSGTGSGTYTVPSPGTFVATRR